MTKSNQFQYYVTYRYLNYNLCQGDEETVQGVPSDKISHRGGPSSPRREEALAESADDINWTATEFQGEWNEDESSNCKTCTACRITNVKN